MHATLERFKRITVVAVPSIAALLLSGCGGGSASSTSPPTSPGGGAGTSSSFSVGGTVSGLGTGQSVTLADNGATALAITANGPFTFSTPLASGTTYAVTVQSASNGVTCAVSGGSGTVTGAVASVQVTCQASTYAIGGSLSGLATGASVTLQNNGADALVLSASGNFSFSQPIADGSSYDVTVSTQPAGETCSVANASGTVAAAVTDVNVVCATMTTASESVLYSFGPSTGTDAANPLNPLVIAPSGNLYGMAAAGGALGQSSHGALFAITPRGAEQFVYSFDTTVMDGSAPASLALGSDGNVYGTTIYGGQFNEGTIFEVLADGSETVLYSFGATGGDGQHPGTLIGNPNGGFYGITAAGGANGEGAVFALSAAGTESIVYSFSASAAVGTKPTSLALASNGDLYGTTELGGANNAGTVFRLTPSGVTTVLYSFGFSGTSLANGNTPDGVTVDASDDLFVVTIDGGVNAGGTAFEIAASGSVTLLHSFGGNGDGINPTGPLAFGPSGNLYGILSGGGANNTGAVFELSLGGVETLLHSFGPDAPGADGADPVGGPLVIDGQGNLYGTTGLGGANGTGVVFKIVP